MQEYSKRKWKKLNKENNRLIKEYRGRFQRNQHKKRERRVQKNNMAKYIKYKKLKR